MPFAHEGIQKHHSVVRYPVFDSVNRLLTLKSKTYNICLRQRNETKQDGFCNFFNKTAKYIAGAVYYAIKLNFISKLRTLKEEGQKGLH